MTRFLLTPLLLAAAASAALAMPKYDAEPRIPDRDKPERRATTPAPAPTGEVPAGDQQKINQGNQDISNAQNAANQAITDALGNVPGGTGITPGGGSGGGGGTGGGGGDSGGSGGSGGQSGGSGGSGGSSGGSSGGGSSGGGGSAGGGPGGAGGSGSGGQPGTPTGPDGVRPVGGARGSVASGAAPLLGRGAGTQTGKPVTEPGDPRTAADFERAARAKFAVGDPLGARDFATRAIAMGGDTPDLLALRSEANNSLKEYDAAGKDADKALEKDPNNARARRNKAYDKYKAGDIDSALSMIDDVFKKTKGDSQAALVRAYLRDQKGDRAGATEDLQRAVLLDPDYAPRLRDYMAGRPMRDPFEPKPVRSPLADAERTVGRAWLVILILAALGGLGWFLYRRRRRAFRPFTETSIDRAPSRP